METSSSISRLKPSYLAKPESGLAEWTSKIKAMQRQVDADEEAEQKQGGKCATGFRRVQVGGHVVCLPQPATIKSTVELCIPTHIRPIYSGLPVENL